jgi:FixH protein
MKRDAWIPWALGAGFGVFLLGGVALSIIAARSDPGLVAGAPQRLAGSYVVPTDPAPVLELRVVGRGAEGVTVEARVRGPDGRPATVEALTGTLGRATHARDDRPVAFAPAAGGAWRAVIAVPGEGTWEVAVRARSDTGTANASLRL